MVAPSLLALIAVLLAFPLLVVLLGEINLRLKRQGKDYTQSITVIRNVLLPLIAIYFLVTAIADIDPNSTLSKLFLTGSVIIGLIALMGIINGVIYERDAGSQFPKLFLDLGRILVIGFGIAMTLSLVWNYDLENLITALGVSSLVLGLALQEPLGNLFNGITLINERPFKVGDFIEVDGHAGKVVEVNWRAVRLLTRERDLIVLPHMKVSQSAIMNHSQPEEQWAQKIMMGFSYDHPPNKVKRVMMDVCMATPGVLREPEPEVKTDEFADSAVIYEIEYYIANYGVHEEIKDDFMTRVWYAAKRHGLNIPFPQMNLHQEPQRKKEERDAAMDQAHLAYAISMLDVPDEADYLQGAEGVDVLNYGEGETLLDQSIGNPGLFLLVSGEVRLQTRDANRETKVISELHRGDFITQVILAGSRTNAVTALATEDSEVVYLPEAIIRSLVNRYPKLAISIEETMATRRKQLRKVLEETRPGYQPGPVAHFGR